MSQRSTKNFVAKKHCSLKKADYNIQMTKLKRIEVCVYVPELWVGDVHLFPLTAPHQTGPQRSLSGSVEDPTLTEYGP